MLLTKEVEMKWHPKTLKWYVDKGYTYTHIGDSFLVNVHDLTKGSSSIVRFKCDNCDNEEDIEWGQIKRFNKDKEVCFCNKCVQKLISGKNIIKSKLKDSISFGQYLINTYGENAIELYWSFENNTLSPFEIGYSSNKKIWIKCINHEYHDDYEISCNHFSQGRRCPLCSKRSGKVHELDSLGSLYPEVLDIWSDKNEKSPYEYSPNSTHIVWWKCSDSKHDDYKRSVSYSNTLNFRCPKCSKELKISHLQKIVSEYILDKYSLYKLNHEYDCTIIPVNPKSNNKCGRLPFDNEIEDLKLVIEIHGQQHYKLLSKNSAWLDGQTPTEYLRLRKLFDRYKRYIAWKNGYHYLIIPYWTDDKIESYKKLIDNKIEEILSKELGLLSNSFSI